VGKWSSINECVQCYSSHSLTHSLTHNLQKTYESRRISADDISTVLYTIGDNHAYLWFNRDPCDRMIKYVCVCDLCLCV
jgi:spore coat protein U-like protein